MSLKNYKETIRLKITGPERTDFKGFISHYNKYFRQWSARKPEPYNMSIIYPILVLVLNKTDKKTI